MAPSRESSPTSDADAHSPEPLTPRSKIKALLATIESSDDDDDAQNASQSPSRRKMAGKSRPARPIVEDDDDSDEPDVVARPRGKLASRMQGAPVSLRVNDAQRSTSISEDNIRQPESQPEDNDSASRSQQTASSAHSDSLRDDEDDDLPVVPRRLKRRALREDSPAKEASEIPARSPSPGLFVSSPMRPSPAKSQSHDSASDNDLPAIKSDRFKALVEKKRRERLAREAAEEARKAEQQAQREKLASELAQLDSDDDDASGITDDEGGRKLTQEARPTRKASKRAIEDMNRETQRMARNMQLAHEAKTRKKITKASLFERFNFRPSGALQTEPKTHSSSRPSTPQSDVEMKDADTPPSSPPTTKEQGAPSVLQIQQPDAHGDMDEELPSLDQVMKLQPLPKDKGKAVATSLKESAQNTAKSKRRVRVRLPAITANPAKVGSDDELEIKCTSKDKINAIFDRAPAQGSKESRSMRALKALALVKSPGKSGAQKHDRSSMTAGELHAQLYQRARQQAKLERDRRLEMLKAQGVVVQTAAERERHEQEVEDLVAKAREEAQAIMQQERADAKKAREESGEADPLAWDDSEDDEYDAANEADGEGSAVELSGSEEEDDEDEDEENGNGDEGEGLGNQEMVNPFLDEDAESGASESDEPRIQETESEQDEHIQQKPAAKSRRARKHTTVLSDDEAEVGATPRPKAMAAQTTPADTKTASPAVPTSVLRSAKKTFIPGLPVQGPAGLGLTQIFAGTMDDDAGTQAGGPTQSLMPDFDQFPDSNFSATADEPEEVIMDTQREETPTETQCVHLNLVQSQMRGLDSLLQDRAETPMSQSMEPSQDVGLQEHTPLRERFVEPPFSTVETIALDKQGDEVGQDSPLIRRGRLRRKVDMSPAEGPTQVADDDAFKILADGAMKDRKRRHEDDFDRKKTKAKEMVEDQAEESEDEYAGIGGADGEDSDNESTGSVQEIIDDASGQVDSRELAAFYADRERAKDEQEVEKLFKDITTGMLRRKRGADYDLSDSDDGGEARRRMKRRQFAKMQKALYADERVKKMAENPGNQAFLRTIEDRGSDDEMDLLDITTEPEQPETQSQPQEVHGNLEREQQKTIPDSQPGKQPLRASEQGRAPAHMRRTADGKKPSNIGQVRETLSDLLEDRQESVIPATMEGSDSEDEDEDATYRRSDKENQAPVGGRRSQAVVDRISLKRNSSSALSSSSTRLAFAVASSSSSFKVPALLRRATTNSSLMSNSATGSSSSSAAATSATAVGSAGGFGQDAKIKKNAGKTSGINGFARGSEQRARLRESERRREQRKVKGAVQRIGVVGGLLGKGSFE
ncbi:hypothetical protein HIM_01069 [Hirsutella minnesotensis 3608]|nr:hypothetical protein HIM_01069 [Hirsutella minnesotensis 3608]